VLEVEARVGAFGVAGGCPGEHENPHFRGHCGFYLVWRCSCRIYATQLTELITQEEEKEHGVTGSGIGFPAPFGRASPLCCSFVVGRASECERARLETPGTKRKRKTESSEGR
jgi:hypothetical protein